jgi:hypothetical protein
MGDENGPQAVERHACRLTIRTFAGAEQLFFEGDPPAVLRRIRQDFMLEHVSS